MCTFSGMRWARWGSWAAILLGVSTLAAGPAGLHSTASSLIGACVAHCKFHSLSDPPRTCFLWAYVQPARVLCCCALHLGYLPLLPCSAPWRTPVTPWRHTESMVHGGRHFAKKWSSRSWTFRPTPRGCCILGGAALHSSHVSRVQVTEALRHVRMGGHTALSTICWVHGTVALHLHMHGCILHASTACFADTSPSQHCAQHVVELACAASICPIMHACCLQHDHCFDFGLSAHA